jgi:hypothetical protein
MAPRHCAGGTSLSILSSFGSPWRLPERKVTLTVAIVAVAVLLAFSSAPRSARAYGWPCEPPAQGGSGPCIAHFYGVNMVAIVVVNGLPIAVSWNFDSQVYFYGFPQNPNEVQVTQLQHAVWTSQVWPYHTWSAGQTTWVEGVRFGSCPSGCVLIWMPIGANYDYPNDFDYQLMYPNQSIWSDFGTKAHATAAIYPASGGGGGFNNSRNECKNVGANGTQDAKPRN